MVLTVWLSTRRVAGVGGCPASTRTSSRRAAWAFSHTPASRHSRNRRAGELLALGRTPEQAAAEIGMVVEGLTTAPVLSALAERAAIALRPPPHYRLRLHEGFSAPKQIEDDCGTLVLAHLGALSTLELGPQPPTATEPAASLNLVRIAEIQAFPQVHTTTYPMMSFMDIDELRRISLGDLWRNRRYGPSYVIYQRVRSHVD